MKLITETIDNNQHILVIDKDSTPLSKLLKEEFKKYGAQIYLSSLAPKDLNKFDYLFFLNQPPPLELIKKTGATVILIFTNNQRKAREEFHRLSKKTKVIHLNSHYISTDQLDKILWFTFSKSDESFLNLELLPNTDKEQKESKQVLNKPKKITKRALIITFITIFLSIHLLMFPFIAAGLYYFSRASGELKKENISQAKSLIKSGERANKFASFFYTFSRPSYLFLSLALFPDNLIQINSQTASVLNQSLALYESGSEVMRLIFKKGKTESERELLALRISRLDNKIGEIEKNLNLLNQRLPSSNSRFKEKKSELIAALDLIRKLKKIIPQLNTLLANGTEKKYLLLFANNMELRPGGGFIGSFGILTMKDLTFENLEIFDVYSADGQLTEHIDPPPAIRTHLNQPNWFLRDSAFSTDFSENYTQAKFFLAKELGFTGFSGGILLTTTAIQHLLKAYDILTIPDFNERVNSENFYIKAQLYSEKDFFPGSIQKKTFLSSVARQMLIGVDTVSPVKLAQAIKQSFDEKQLVAIFEDSSIQKVIDSLFWSGKTVILQCPSGVKDCIPDYIMPVDANLGVNKANFYVSRLLSQKVRIDESGIIHSNFTLHLKNDSPNAVFPGGSYKNYFQLYLPSNVVIKKVTKNGVRVEDFDLSSDVFTRIGFLAEILPQTSSIISVEYELGNKLKTGRHIYQFVVEKQIGSKNSDLNLEVILPKNIHLIDQNFSPLVKENHILYNTNLSADKIFLFEFQKDN